jgi:ribokinase
MQALHKNLLVCGSINMDLVLRTPQLPKQGQTLIAKSLVEVPGGKGANQAVAAARLGARVSMLGAVGSDAFGASLALHLKKEQVDTKLLCAKSGPSGIAVITVEDDGENAIMVVPGANGLLSPEDVNQAESAIRDADWVMAQLEIPLPTVKRLIELCRRHATKIILNPAPAPTSMPEAMYQVDLLCPNQSETAALLGCPPPATIDQATDAARILLDRGALRAVITLGSLGAVAAQRFPTGRTETRWIEPFNVKAVDTVAAGDAFLGALATELAEDVGFLEACRFAAAAAAYAVTIPGAQPSLPTRSQVRAILTH